MGAWTLCTNCRLDSLDTPATEKNSSQQQRKHWRWHFATRSNNQPQPQIASNNKNTTRTSSLTSAVLWPLQRTLPRNTRSPCRHRRLSGNSWISGTTGWHDHRHHLLTSLGTPYITSWTGRAWLCSEIALSCCNQIQSNAKPQNHARLYAPRRKNGFWMQSRCTLTKAWQLVRSSKCQKETWRCESCW